MNTVDILVIFNEAKTILALNIILFVSIILSIVVFCLILSDGDEKRKKKEKLKWRKQEYKKIKKRYGKSNEICVKLILEDLKEGLNDFSEDSDNNLEKNNYTEE